MSGQTARKALFIINPKAGRRMGRALQSRLTNLFAGNGMRVTTINTRGRGHAKDICESTGARYDLVVCAGGDGTLHEVVDGLMQLPSPPRLGYIPAGTCNDVAYSLGLPTRPMDAGHVILRGEARKMDIGRFQDTFFVYVACFGMFSDVSYMTSQLQKNQIGRLACFFEAVKRMRRIPSHRVRIEYDGGAIEDEFAFCSITNTQRIGGGIIHFPASDTLLDDGLFEMLLIKKPSGLPALARVISQLYHRRYDSQSVYLLHTSSARLRCDIPIQWTLDGENGGAHREVRIENRRHGINIIT